MNGQSNGIVEKIRQFLAAEVTHCSQDEIKGDWALISEIDSLDIQALIVFLESEFEISVDDMDVTVENFESVNRVADLVRRKLARTSSHL